MAETNSKRHWQPSEAAFHRFLAWLDDGSDSRGERYLDIRDRLVHYFARRGSPTPDDLADETLNRVARRLEEIGSIDDIEPARYCYVVAKFVLLESSRRRAALPAALADREGNFAIPPAMLTDQVVEDRERLFECLGRCLEAQPASERELILAYYRTDSGSAHTQRKQLAERLGLTANSLAIRACRIRSRLETCVRTCLAKRHAFGDSAYQGGE
jgi:DNA-directed RNA polymerase specialized sigma24 family protein